MGNGYDIHRLGLDRALILGIVAERSKLKRHIEGMRSKPAQVLGIAADPVGVNATTNEKNWPSYQ